jgi:hypothetical protein
MNTQTQCLTCGDTRLEPGVLHSARFRPDNTKFLTLQRDIEVRAIICLSCGHIELSGDVSKVQNRLMASLP